MFDSDEKTPAEINQPTRGRKRIANESEWRRNIIKRCRVAGTKYLTWRGTKAPAVQPGRLCGCKKLCKNLLQENDRRQVFTNFRQVKDEELAGQLPMRIYKSTCRPTPSKD